MNITIEPMRPGEIPAVSAMMGQAYVTSPLNIAAFGSNLHRNEGFFRVAIEHLQVQTFVAKDDGQIVGAMGMAEWPNCQLPPLKMLPLLPSMLKVLGGSIINVFKWLPVWAKLDPKQPHWHFGPFSVLPERQQQGIGSKLLTYFCEHVDRLGAAAYLETDKPENVRLYQRFGFEVTSEAPVLGVPNWFMWRSPQPKV